jgi:hypothetical protein
MNYLLLFALPIAVFMVLMFLVNKIRHQSRELGFAMNSSKRKIREISKKIKEIEKLEPEDLTEEDKKKLAILGGLLKKLSNNNTQNQ